MIIWINRRAKYDYNIEATKEAGVVLTGSQVKSIRQIGVNLRGVYAAYHTNTFWLYNLSISPYSGINGFTKKTYNEPIKLLLNKREIRKWLGISKRPGYSIIPLKAYFNEKGLFKIEVGLCKGKTQYDKRQSEKEKEDRREISLRE